LPELLKLIEARKAPADDENGELLTPYFLVWQPPDLFLFGHMARYICLTEAFDGGGSEAGKLPKLDLETHVGLTLGWRVSADPQHLTKYKLTANNRGL
jgi:hypothetical protein